jgi:outer membrane receptor protein involved in Fe transport
MGLTALAASVAPREQALRGSQAERRQPPRAAEAAPTVQTIRREISADATAQRVVVGEGDLLELEVTGSTLGAVELLGEIDAVAPGTGARFHILAGEADEHPIELIESGRRIGTLVIR